MAEQDDTYFANLPEEVVREATKPPAPWDEGDYKAEITEAAVYQGEGKPYPCVQLNVMLYNSEGKSKKVRTWVLSKNPAINVVKSGLDFLKAVGLSRTTYRNPAQLVGLATKVRVRIKGDYNEIAYFLNR